MRLLKSSLLFLVLLAGLSCLPVWRPLVRGGIPRASLLLPDPGRNLIRRPADYVVIFLRITIDDADAGAGGQVVELIEQDFLPVFRNLGGGIILAVEIG